MCLGQQINSLGINNVMYKPDECNQLGNPSKALRKEDCPRENKEI